MNTIKGRLRVLLQNQWFKFSIAAVLYLLFVIWLQNYWFLTGLAVIFDMYITKKVRWAFWKPRQLEGKPVRRSGLVEWLDAIVFAVIAASIIRIFFIEAYTIPTSSMEKTMLVGDYLFVSKVAYGPKVPNTPVAFPLVHHTLPFTQHTPSFLTWIQNPYRRLKGFGDVERNDIVVFNFPEGDTVVAQIQNQSYYDLVRHRGREQVWNSYDVLVRPVDKRENYIKRCVAVAGDSLQIKKGKLYINGVEEQDFDGVQRVYFVKTNGSLINPKTLDDIGIPHEDRVWNSANAYYAMPLTQQNLEAVKKIKNVLEIVPYEQTQGSMQMQEVFPQISGLGWTVDNYGPIYIPKKGVTVSLDPTTLPFYERIIAVYENNRLDVKEDGSIYINEQLATNYTFKMDYYWMMGDNRHKSLDSRYWGFVPEDHVVGRPLMVWLSLNPDKSFPFNIRWGRLFSFIHN